MYSSWSVILNGDKIIGYTHTDKEADDICKIKSNLSWELAEFYFTNSLQLKIQYQQLPYLTLSDFI